MCFPFNLWLVSRRYSAVSELRDFMTSVEMQQMIPNHWLDIGLVPTRLPQIK